MTDRVSTIRLRADISDLQAKLVAAGRSVSSVADQATKATKESRKFRDGLSSAGDAAGKMALVTGAAFVGIAASAANFDQAMSNVQAATHETADSMDQLRDAALEAGARTVFSATEAAAAIENLAKAGVSTRDILGGGLNGALDLAAAGSLDVADAAEIAATAMTQFGLSGTQVPHIADLLAAAAGKAQGEVTDMAMALKQGGLVANQVGLSIEETTGALAAFASAGLLGSDAGTSFKTMLGALTPNSAKAAESMKELGITAFDAQGNFVGLAQFAGILRTAMQGLTDEQRQARLETIFGSDAVRAASVIYNEGATGIQEWINAVDDQGFAAETAAIKLDNLKGDLEALTGSLETLFITSGEGSQNFLRGATQNATDFVNMLNNLPGPVKNTTTALLGITALTGGALWFGSRVVRGVADTRRALDDLGDSGKRAGRALKGLTVGTAVISGLYALDTVLRTIGDGGSGAADTVEELTGKLLDLSGGQIDSLGGGFKDLGESLDLMGSRTTNVVGGLESLIPVLPQVAEGLSGLLGFDDESVDTKLKNAAQQIDTLDAALSGLVSSASPEAARNAFDALAEAQGLSSDETKQLLNLLPSYRDALAGVENDTRLAAGGERDFTGAIADQTGEIEKNVKAMREKRDLALAAENAEIGYQRALDEARKSLKENGKTLDITTEKGRQNRESLLDIAGAWNDLSDREKNARGARKQAIDDFADMAVKMGMTEKAARAYARRLLDIPTKVVTRATLETANAKRELDTFVRYANNQRIVLGAGLNVAQARAEGGPIYGPGTKSSDSIPALLSNGEFVMKADAVDRYGLGMMWAINAGRYAEGGLASRGGEMHGARSYTTNNFYNQAAPAVRATPIFDNATIRMNDMRELVSFARQAATLVDGGGVNF